MFGGPLSDIPYRVSPGFSSIDAGMYVWAAALHHSSPPLSSVLPSVGGRSAVAVAPLPRRLHLGPLTHAVVSALASTPNGEFVTVLCLCSCHCLTVSGSTGQWCPLMRNCAGGRFFLRLPIRVPPCLPLGLATLWLGHCIPVSSSIGQCYPWMMYAEVCGCSSHPAVTLRVDGSRCMWPFRSSLGVPTTG